MTRRRSRARRWLRAAVAVVLLGGLVLGALGALVWLGVLGLDEWASPRMIEARRRAQALVLAVSESLPVYRVQLMTTTCDLPAGGTDNAVRVKLNADNGTWLDYSHDDFERGASFTYDLGLEHVSALRDVATLDISKNGDDAWCLRDLKLYVNDGLMFERAYPGPGRWLTSGRRGRGTLSIPGTQLRSDPNWTRHRPSLPPGRIARRDLESRIESTVGNALYGQQVTWRRAEGRAVELTRLSRLTYRGELNLEVRLDNWPDPEIDVTFHLAISCRSGQLMVRVRELGFDVDSPWYSDAATLGLLDRKIEQTLQEAVGNVPLTRTTAVLVCPPALGITSEGDLLLY